MWSRSCVGSAVWNLHLLHLNWMSRFDGRFKTCGLISILLSCNSGWTFWTWSLISLGFSELYAHLLHLNLPITGIDELYLKWDGALNLLYWIRAWDWHAVCLWALKWFWLNVEKPQLSQRIGSPSLSTKCLLFFWNKPWALLMCSRKEVFQVEL